MFKIFDKKHRSRTLSYLFVLVLYIALEVLLKTGNISYLMQNLLVPTCCYIVMALALNLVVGFSGNLSLGQAGFMSAGAFTAAVMSAYFSEFIDNGIVVLILSTIMAGIVAGIFGLIVGIPVLKLEGDYLAIVTLAFCQIIKSIFNNLYVAVDGGLKFAFVNNDIELSSVGKMIVKGATGATIANKLSSFTAGIILIFITLFIIYNILYSKDGRAILATRDNAIAATSIGINTTKYKLLVFVVSAILCGMAGSIYALNYASITAAKFDYNTSILILVYVVLGGLGNLNGTIVSTIILLLLPELLRELNNYRMLIYSIVLIVIMLLKNNKKISNELNKLIGKIKKWVY